MLDTDIAILYQVKTKRLNEAVKRNLPYVFTEQGIAMLSAVLRSDVAINVSIGIMKTFVEMRKYMANASLLYEKINSMEVRQIAFEEKTDGKLYLYDVVTIKKETSKPLES